MNNEKLIKIRKGSLETKLAAKFGTYFREPVLDDNNNIIKYNYYEDPALNIQVAIWQKGKAVIFINRFK